MFPGSGYLHSKDGIGLWHFLVNFRIYKYINLPVNVIIRLPHPQSGDPLLTRNPQMACTNVER